MTVTPHFLVASMLAGCVSGIATGAQRSWLLAVAGGLVGLLTGIASFCAFTVPYAWWIIQWERRQDNRTVDPPEIWRLLFLPAMIASVVTAGIVPYLLFSLI